MTVLYWFRQDRRLADNPALLHAAGMGQRLLPVTMRQQSEQTTWGFERHGPLRLGFDAQALAGLAQALENLGSALYQPNTPGVAGLIEVARDVGATHVVCEALSAPEEQAQIQALKRAGLHVLAIEQSALIGHDRLPFAPQDTPNVFSEFRRQIERAPVKPRTPLAAPETLPDLPATMNAASRWGADIALPPLDQRSAFAWQTAPWHGDEQSAQAHLARYFEGHWPQHYKQTRNRLSGTHDSTKFSPWLAVGALSAAQIWHALKTHEARFGANDSTYWIGFELLWRDHFRLIMQRYGAQLFRTHGIAVSHARKHQTSAQGFERWRLGQTGHRLIDAGMRELAGTGYLSNRMRQIVASYLIHEMRGDWLAGAAWFEHCLIDFDVHSNQGNWAYIAGVGTDPRAGRQFNPDKQAREHDPDERYRNLWSQP